MNNRKQKQRAGKREFIKMPCLLLVALLLTACSISPSYEKAGDMVSFSYGWGHDHGSEQYEITVTDTGVEYNKFVFNKAVYSQSVLLPAETIDDLDELIKQNRIWKWDGFNKKQKGMADGFGYHLEVVYENKTLKSHGYGYTPQGFEDGSKAIEEFFKIIDRKIEDGEY